MPQHDTTTDADDANDASSQTDTTANPQQDNPGSAETQDDVTADPQHDTSE